VDGKTASPRASHFVPLWLDQGHSDWQGT